MKILFYETVDENSKYLTVAVTKSNANFNSLQDLEGAKACFPTNDGIAWNSVANYLNQKSLFESCPISEGMRHFFGDSCVPGLKGEKSSLTTICRNGTYEGEDGAIRCLIDGAGDVAFISKNSLRKFLAGKRKN